jgi:hypothetical protein
MSHFFRILQDSLQISDDIRLFCSDFFGEMIVGWFLNESSKVRRRHSSDPARERFGKILGSSHENNVESLWVSIGRRTN